MSFVEVQFPADISYGSSGGPEYSTDIVETFSGHEQRNINWSQSRAKYNVVHGVKTQAQLDELIKFFRARQGRAIGFRFKDWTDYKAIGQNIGAGDGVETDFQMIKKYTSGAVTINRIIKKPVDNSTLKIFLDAVEQVSGFTVDFTNGIITFDTPPGMGVVISVDFEFDIPVRFDTDHLNATIDDFGSNTWGDIPIVELRI